MAVTDPGVGDPNAWSLELDAEDLSAAGLRLAAEVHLLDRVDSTNDVARRLAQAGAVDGTLVVARQQDRGRGRRRRHWRSGRGGLYLSVVLRPRRLDFEYAAAVQLGAAVAVAEALTPWLPAPPELLWPNDVLCRGQKVAGVLAESDVTGEHLETLVMGIGINVAQPATCFDGDLRGSAASIAMLGGSRATLAAVLIAVMHRLDHWERVARDAGMASVAERWMAFAQGTTRGSIVDVETAGGVIRGQAAGLSSRGGLLVETAAGPREILTGELIRVRRRT